MQINASTDLDERSALRSLVGVIDGVKKAVEKRMVSIASPSQHDIDHLCGPPALDPISLLIIMSGSLS